MVVLRLSYSHGFSYILNLCLWLDYNRFPVGVFITYQIKHIRLDVMIL